MNPFLIYLWGIADSLQATIYVLAVLSAVASLIAFINRDCTFGSGAEEKKAALAKTCKKLVRLTALLWVFAPLIPSSGTIAAMVVIPAIVESEVIREDIPELYDAAMRTLKSKLGVSPEVEK